MKKIFFICVSATCLAIGCNSNNTMENTVIIQTADTVAKSTNTAADMIVAVNDVSASEMKDDAVFADGSIPTSWENAGITDVRGLKLFLKQVQQWVITNNKVQLALAVKYPLNNIQHKEDLMAAYDQVFTKDVKLSFAIINFNQIFRNSKGVMTSGGRAWITQEGTNFKIFAINP
ncbi:MAG: hypothetical protein WD135_09455 [Ferruginibacter sp.]